MNKQNNSTPASEGGHDNTARFGFRVGRGGAHGNCTPWYSDIAQIGEVGM